MLYHKFFLTFFFLFHCFPSQSQHQWQGTNPGGGGAVSLVGATASGYIVAGSDLSGVYITKNNGDSWKALGSTQGLTDDNITSFGFHPTDGNTFIIGTGLGAFKTTDAGNSICPVQIEVRPNFGVGYVESIGMAMSDSNIGYMAHHEHWVPEVTLLKTTDAGDSWNIVQFTGLPDRARIVKILVDRHNANIVYTLTGKARHGCSDPNLYRSTDGGETWREIALQLGSILDFDLHPWNPNIVYVTTFEDNGCEVALWQYPAGDINTGAFYKSTNGGTSFTQIGEQTGIISVGKNPTNISLTDIIFPFNWNENAGTWKTTNGGGSWTHTGFVDNWKPGWGAPEFWYTASFNGLAKTLTKDRFNPDKLYGSFGQWAWLSTDGGNILNNISTKEVTPNHFLTTGLENIEGNALEISARSPNIVYMGGYDLGFWYSNNHGVSWKRSLPSNSIYPDYSWYAEGGSNCNFIVNDPEREATVWAAFSATQPTTKSALFKSTAYGENWTISNNGMDPLGVAMHGLSLDIKSPLHNRTLFVTQNGKVYKSTNDGQNWSDTQHPTGGMKFTAIDKFNGNLVYAGGENGLWKSTNGGFSWAEIGLPEMRFIASQTGFTIYDDIAPTFSNSSRKKEPYNGVFDIQTDPQVPNRVYVVAHGEGKGLYRSDDAGATWNKIYSNSKMRGVAIAPENSEIIYTSSSHSYHSGGYNTNSLGFLVSYNAGQTWVTANEGLAWTNGGKMKIATGDAPHIWAWSPGTGVHYAKIPNYTTSANCSAATSNNATLPNEAAINIQPRFQDQSNSSFAANMEAYLAKRKTPSLALLKENEKPFTQENTLTVFPNPFSKQATIQVDLKESSTISLRIYNQEGKLVESIVTDTQYKKGSHLIPVDAKQLSDGLYWVQLVTEQSIQNTKLVLMKE